jgi:hypothetical protein
MPRKYKNKKCEFDGLKFDSHAERDRYQYLRLLERAGHISNLRCQPRFLLVEQFRRKGRLFLAEFYIADFEYREDYKSVVEDVKGVSTSTYMGKRKHFLKLNPRFNVSRSEIKGAKMGDKRILNNLIFTVVAVLFFTWFIHRTIK